MNRLIPAGVVIALSVLCSEIAHGTEQPDRPNVVYIALEDITPMMGCYGDTYAKTPVFDKLAQQGIRYTRAYSVGPVCSVSRSSIVTGMYPTSIGTMHHRSRVGDPPAFLKMIPNLMREAGYFTTNNKTDFNIQGAHGTNQNRRIWKAGVIARIRVSRSSVNSTWPRVIPVSPRYLKTSLSGSA